jgi:hypothetical protein
VAGSEKSIYSIVLRLPETVTKPNCYELLGLERFTGDQALIQKAETDRFTHILRFQNYSDYGAIVRLENEIAAAGDILKDPEQKAEYDEFLRTNQGITSVTTPASDEQATDPSASDGQTYGIASPTGEPQARRRRKRTRKKVARPSHPDKRPERPRPTSPAHVTGNAIAAPQVTQSTAPPQPSPWPARFASWRAGTGRVLNTIRLSTGMAAARVGSKVAPLAEKLTSRDEEAAPAKEEVDAEEFDAEMDAAREAGPSEGVVNFLNALGSPENFWLSAILYVPAAFIVSLCVAVLLHTSYPATWMGLPHWATPLRIIQVTCLS